jgi:hypothetical protein
MLGVCGERASQRCAQACAALTNLPCVRSRWDGRCAVCGLAGAGAVVACQQPGGCPVQFHVLCARNIGLHLRECLPAWVGA